MKKNIVVFTVMLICFLFATNKTYAAKNEDEFNFDYSGQLDTYTGKPISNDGEYFEKVVKMKDGSDYDRDSHMFIFSVDEGTVKSSVADGMVVTESVELEFSKNANVKLYKDGEEIKSIPENIEDTGNYVVTTNGKDSSGKVMGFQIVNSRTGLLDRYNMPEGFTVQQVTLNAKDIPIKYNVVDLSEDGDYVITYKSGDNGIDYKLAVEIDHTPPAVKFKGINKKNIANGPVTVEGLTQEDEVSVTRDGEPSKLNFRSQITRTGKYRVVVTDDAGNVVEKEFRILLYFNFQAWMFVSVMLAVVIGVLVALLITRKRLRIR